MALTYTLNSGSTFGGTISLSGATDFTFSMEGSTTDLATDGSKSINLTVVDRKKASITVNGIDISVGTNANIQVGKSGALVLKAIGRGAGDAETTAMTITFAEAVVTGISPNVPNDSNSTISITFSAYDSDDNGSIVAYS